MLAALATQVGALLAAAALAMLLAEWATKARQLRRLSLSIGARAAALAIPRGHHAAL
jgi:hypothetical protein